MDIIQLPERNDKRNVSGINGDLIDGGPSMEDIITSMRNHLLAGDEAKTAHNTDLNAEHVKLNMPGKQNFEESKHNHTNAKVLQMLNGHKSLRSNGQRGLTEEEIASFNNGGLFSGDEEEDKVSVSSARLCTPFYDELRKKYPQAFLRKRTSISSNASDTSSFYGGETPRRVRGTPRGMRTRNTPRAAEGELPPKHPSAGQSRKPAAHNGGALHEESHSHCDMSISGVPRRGVRTGRLQGILKNSRQYSSTLSLQNESSDSKDSNLTRSESTLSLQERLKQHQNSWKSMFSDDNSAFLKIKRTASIESLDEPSPVNSKILPTPPMKPKPQGSHTIKTLQELQNKIADTYIEKTHISDEHQFSLPGGQKRTMAENRGRGDVRTKRFASPDSSHDSAVEMDNGSVQSGPLKESWQASRQKSTEKQSSQKSSKPAERQQRGQSPSRPRTPKLKSQSRSNSPMIPNGFVNDVSDAQLQGQLSPAGLSLGLGSSSVVQGLSEMELPGFTGHLHNRDSDCDSGIIQGGRGHGSVSSNDDEIESIAHRVHTSQKLSGINQPSLRQRTRRDPEESTLTQKQGPVKANHAIPMSPPGLSPRQQKRPLENGQHDSVREKGARPKTRIFGDPGPVPASSSQRSRSAERKRERVTFEDEVMSAQKLSHAHRANSQPVLNYIAPPPDFAEINAPIYDLPMCEGYDMDTNSPHGYKQPVFSMEQDLLQGSKSVSSPHGNIHTSPDLVTNKFNRDGEPRPATPNQQVIAAVLAEDNLESSMEYHRASPVILGPEQGQRNSKGRPSPPPYKPKTCIKEHAIPRGGVSIHDLPIPPPCVAPTSSPPPPPTDLNSSFNSEVAMFSGFTDDISFDKVHDQKKSKLPWKKNKGRYTPTKEMEKMQQNKVLSSDSRTGSWSSINTDVQPNKSKKPPTHKKTKGPGSHPVPPPRRKRGKSGKIPVIEHVDADRMSQFSGDGYEPIDSVTPSPRRTIAHVENTYEEVNFKVPLAPPPKGYTDENDNPQKEDIYAMVKKPPHSKKASPYNNPAIANDYDNSIEYIGAPPLPQRGYTSDLEKHRDLSGSVASLSDRMGSFKDSAKKKFNQVRKALSLERLDKSSKEEQFDTVSMSSMSSEKSGRLKKSGSLRSLTEALGFKKKEKEKKVDDQKDLPPTHRRPPRPQILSSKRSLSSAETSQAVEQPTNFRTLGKLHRLNSDGTLVLELTRPPHGPFGFYIARGNVKFNHGIFVSRLSDALPESFFAGLLGVGDEILEINGTALSSLPLESVYALMAGKDVLVLKTLPYVARKDN